jgi:predicted exporter
MKLARYLSTQNKNGILLVVIALLLVVVISINIKPNSDMAFLTLNKNIQKNTTNNNFIINSLLNRKEQNLFFIQISNLPLPKLIKANRTLVKNIQKSKITQRVLNGTLHNKKNLKALQRSLLFKYRYLANPEFNPKKDLKAEKIIKNIKNNNLLLQNSVMRYFFLQDPLMLYFKTIENEHKTSYPLWIRDNKQKTYVMVVTDKKSSIDDLVLIANEIKKQTKILEKNFTDIKIKISGSGYFASKSKQKINTTILILSIVASIGITAILLFFFKQKRLILWFFLPVLISACVATLIVNFVHGNIHVITLAFASILLGISFDYVIHFLSANSEKKSTNKKFWQILYLSVGSTLVGFAFIATSDIKILAQLGLFMFCGIIVSVLILRFFFFNITKHIHLHATKISKTTTIIKPIWQYFIFIVIITIFITIYDKIYLNYDIQKFSPIPQEELDDDKKIRQDINLPDFGKMLIIKDKHAQGILKQSLQLMPALNELKQKKLISSYDMLAKYINNKEQQLAIQKDIPSPTQIRKLITKIAENTNIKKSSLKKFQSALMFAKNAKPIDITKLKNKNHKDLLNKFLIKDDEHYYGLILLKGISSLAAFKKEISKITSDRLFFINIKEQIQNNILETQKELIQAIGVFLLCFIVILSLFLRSFIYAIKIIAPIIISGLIVVIFLAITNIAINIFHLVAFLLLVTLGLDYVLFSNLKKDKPTNFALKISFLSTFIVFFLLIFSDILVLSSIGMVVGIGISLIYFFSRNTPKL